MAVRMREDQTRERAAEENEGATSLPIVRERAVWIGESHSINRRSAGMVTRRVSLESWSRIDEGWENKGQISTA